MFPVNYYKNASSALTFILVVAHRLCLDPVKQCLLISFSFKVDISIPQLHCHFVGVASQLVRSADVIKVRVSGSLTIVYDTHEIME